MDQRRKKGRREMTSMGACGEEGERVKKAWGTEEGKGSLVVVAVVLLLTSS